MGAGVELPRVRVGTAHAGVMTLQTLVGVFHASFGEEIILQVILHQQRHGSAAGGDVGPISVARPVEGKEHPRVRHVMVKQGFIGGHQTDDDRGHL